jgi:hypothetical protein
MKQFLLLSLALLLSCTMMLAQEDEKPVLSKFSFHADGGTIGYASSATVNFEGRLSKDPSKKVQLFARIGGGWVEGWSIFCDDRTSYGALGGLTLLTGTGNHHLEVSGGGFLGNFEVDETILFCSEDDGGFKPLPLLDVGYRYQKPEGGLIFRVKAGLLGVGLGLGYSF